MQDPQDLSSEPRTVEARVRAALAAAEASASFDDAFPFVVEAVIVRLRQALEDMGAPNPEQQIALLQQTGLDRLLVESFLARGLTPAAAEAYLAKVRGELRDARLDGETLKLALVAFDGVMQRLALVAEPGQMAYPRQGNPARDLLIGFAHSLHR